MKTISSRDVRPGDVVCYAGQRHRVDHVDRGAGWAWPVAADGSGWAMALGDTVVIVDQAA